MKQKLSPYPCSSYSSVVAIPFVSNVTAQPRDSGYASPVDKKLKPVGVCTVCGAYTDQRIDVNSRCNKRTTGTRCAGIYKSGLGQVWAECYECKGYGQVGSMSCSECKGFGWKLMK